MNYVLYALLSLSLTSCFQMSDEEFSDIPLTNNPRVISQKNTGLTPSVSY